MTTVRPSPGIGDPPGRPRPLTGWLHGIVHDPDPLPPGAAATLVEYAVDRGQRADFVAAAICRPEIGPDELDRIRAHVDTDDATIACALAFRQTDTADAFVATAPLGSGLRPLLRLLDEDYLHAVTAAIDTGWDRTGDLPGGQVGVLAELISRTSRLGTQMLALRVVDEYASAHPSAILPSYYFGALRNAAPAAVADLAVQLRTIHALPVLAASALPTEVAAHLAHTFVLPQLAALPTHTERLSVEELATAIAGLLPAWPADVAADVFTAAASTQLPLPTVRALTGPFVAADAGPGGGSGLAALPQIDWGQWPLDAVLACAAPAGPVRDWVTRTLRTLPGGVTVAEVDQLAGSFLGTFNELLEVLSAVTLKPAA